jgi:hypothetical protein
VSDGATEGEHRQSAAAQFEKLGIKPKQPVVIVEPPFPRPLRYLWDWYLEIRRGIDGNGTTFPVITWQAIDCWARLTRQEIEPRDAKVIVTLGNIWAAIMAEKVKVEDAVKR